MGYEYDTTSYKRKICLKGGEFQEVNGSFYLGDTAEQFIQELYKSGFIMKEGQEFVVSVIACDKKEDNKCVDYKVTFRLQPQFFARKMESTNV